MELWLVDIDRDLTDAWATEFANEPNVFVRHGDILALAENALVSPANSYGWMDGGIDRLYTDYFGLQLQARLQAQIDETRGGKLEVGAALLLRTGDQRIPFLISAPTMVNPGPVGPENGRRPTACRAGDGKCVAQVGSGYAQRGRSVTSPGTEPLVRGLVRLRVRSA